MQRHLYNGVLQWGGQGQYERADSIAQLAMNLWRNLRGEDNLSYGIALFASAGMQFQGGHTLAATNTYEQCLMLWRKNNLGRPELFTQILDYLALCYYQFGKLSKAEVCFKESIEISDAFPNMIPVPFMAQGNLANILIDKGRYAEADQTLADLEDKLEKAGLIEDARYAEIFNAKAQFLSRINQYEEAIEYSKKARSILVQAFGANNPYLFTSDIIIGNALANLGKPQEAITVFKAALDSMRVQDGEDWYEYSEIRSSLASCYTKQHQYNAAIQLYLDAITHYGNSTDKGNDQIIKEIYLGLADTYRYVQDYAASKKYLQKFMSIDVPNDVIDNWANFLQSESYFIEKNYPAVIPEATTYANRIKQQTSNEIFLFDDQKRQSQVEDLHVATDALLTLVRADVSKKIPEVTKIALDFQLFTKSLLLTATRKIRTEILNGKDENLKQRYTDWINQKEELAYYYTRSKTELAQENIEISKLEARADSLEKAIARASAAYNNVTDNLNINWQSIHTALQPGQAALEIARYQGQLNTISDDVHYAIFVLTPDQTEPAVVFIEDGDALEQVLIEKHLSACANPAMAEPGSDLYNAVWKQVEPYLKNVKTIFIAADGCFHKINFASLRQPDGSYLADHYTFRPVFSLKDIVGTKNTEKQSFQEKTAFLLGNPTFAAKNDKESTIAGRTRAVSQMQMDTSSYDLYNPLAILRDIDPARGMDLKPLPGSQKEVDDLAALLKQNGWQTTLRTGTEAREEEVKTIHSPTVLHLATHGYFLSNERAGTAGLSRETIVRNPLLRSMLFFVGAQNTLDRKPLDGKEDGILTAYEVQNMNLEGTELVVLSACKTAQGKVQNGEGVYGLQRALRIAGAQCVVLSLWDVDDEVGRAFMQLFYEQWLNGKTKNEAFQMTQLAIKAHYPHPFYWAGFVLIE